MFACVRARSRPSDEVHAERDLQRVAEVMKRMG